MAQLKIDGSDLVLELTPFERLGSLLGEVRVPMEQVESVRAVDDPWREVGGVRIGLCVPWVIFVGSILRRGANDVVAIRGRGPAVAVQLRQGAKYRRLIVTDAMPQLELRVAVAPTAIV